MIHLTRLNNASLTLNSDLIKSVEQAPDTVITLITGEKIIVRESTAEVVDRVIAFRRSIVSEVGAAPEIHPLSYSPADGATQKP